MMTLLLAILWDTMHIHERIECEDLLTEVLSPLSDLQRKIVGLRIQGISIRKIGSIVGKGKTTVYHHLLAIREMCSSLQGV